MNPETMDKDMKKYEVQQELMNVLENLDEPQGSVPHFEIEATFALDVDKGNHLYNMVDIMAPKMRDAKVLDLFCGANSIKLYFQEHNFPGQVTGVDIEDEKADIKADVGKIATILPPEGQFDIVVSSGSVPDIEDYQTTARYLNDDGIYITGGSEDVFKDDIQPVLEDPSVKPKSEYQKETHLIQEIFRPVAVLETRHIPNKFGYDLTDVYVIWRKRQPK